MAETKTYNGWTNYESWAVALWLDNEQDSYNYWRKECFRALKRNSNDKDDAAQDIAAQLKAEIEEANPLAGSASMFSDLLGAALSEVNWYEIAANWIGEVYEEQDADE